KILGRFRTDDGSGRASAHPGLRLLLPHSTVSRAGPHGWRGKRLKGFFPMASIDIQSVRKSYGEHAVLHGVDLEIKDGEFIVLVGPSGCGKSTLLRMIAGLEDITSGQVQISGKRVNELAPKDRDIAMVFQSYALYPHMSVADNMSYSMRLRKTPKEKIASAIQSTAAKLGLEPLLDRRPKALTGGQRQRVAMGRAIVRQPKAFLFDEPL